MSKSKILNEIYKSNKSNSGSVRLVTPTNQRLSNQRPGILKLFVTKLPLLL